MSEIRWPCPICGSEKDTASQLAAARAAQDNLRHELSRLRNRPADEPGGMECQKCGCIFVGSEADAECGVCCLKSQLAAARADIKQLGGVIVALKLERDTAYAKGMTEGIKGGRIQMREEAARACEDRGTSYQLNKAPGWQEVVHESDQCAAAIRNLP